MNLRQSSVSVRVLRLTALFLFILSLAHTQTLAQGEAAFPTIMVKDSAGTSSPLRMNELKIEVKVIGNLATTTMEMNFHNDLDRVLEGQLYFPLGEGQTVSRFAMDVEGKLREGVVVEKAKGRVAFESTVRRKIDPGLLEWTAGNNFKSRVYPIPAKGDKRILVAYEQELKHTEEGTEYLLPLQFQEKLDQFDLKVEVYDQPVAPDLHGNTLEGLNFEKFERTFVAKMQKKDYLANQQLAFRLPKPSKYTEIFIEQEAKEGNYFFLHLNPEITERPKEMPKKICLLWDVSNSAGGRNLEQEIALLDQYFQQVQNAELHLVTFSTSIHSRAKGNLSKGDWKAMRATIRNLKYDGGTQFGCLDFRGGIGIECDEYLLFSDGISNFGESKAILPNEPVYTINSQATANHTKLTQIAEETGARYVNLNEMKPGEAMDALRLLPFRFISAQYSRASIEEVYPSGSRPIDRDFSLAGKLKTQNATITLNFGIGDAVLEKQVIVLDQRKQRTESGLVRRIWAQKKLADLERNAEENEEEITALGKKYSIVTRNTSLIVLDRLEDYVQHKIVPPKEMQEAYFEKIEAEWKRESGTQKMKIETVVKLFEKQKEWWATEFKWPKIEAKNPDSDKTLEEGEIEVDANGSAGDAANIEEPALRPPPPPEPEEEPDAVEELRRELETLQEVTLENTETLRSQEERLEEISLEEADINEITEEIEELAATEDEWDGTDGDFGGDDWGDDFGEEESIEEVVIMETDAAEAESIVYDGVIEDDDWGEVEPEPEPAPEPVPEPDPGSFTITANGATSVDLRETQNAQLAMADSTVITTTRSRNMSGKGEIKLQEWDPDEPYMEKLKSVSPLDLYDTYLELKPAYASSPSFYLDCADYFRKVGRKQESLRILSNIAELELDNYRLLRILGHRLEQLGEIDLAVLTFREVLDMREEEPQSYRDLALALAEQGEAQEAVDLLWKVVETDWDGRFPEIEVIAVEELNHIASQARRKPDLSKVDPRLRKELPLNVRVVVNWDADNCDMDLWVTDPTGEKCYYQNRETKIGGYMSRDFTGGYGPEEFLLKRAMPGTYKVQVNYYSNRQQNLTGATTVQVTMYTDYGTRKEKRQDVTLRLKDRKETVEIGAFEY